MEIACERYAEREPHPGGQEAFTIRSRFPWHSRLQARVMIEVTIDERILWPVRRLPVIHAYGESLPAGIEVYSLEEIVAEKLRALLQQADLFERRAGSRSRARDYYDLWRILATYQGRMNLAGFETLLREKCSVRGVSLAGHPDEFLHDAMLAHVEETWEHWLGPLVPQLPPFAIVTGRLRPAIADLFSSG